MPDEVAFRGHVERARRRRAESERRAAAEQASTSDQPDTETVVATPDTSPRALTATNPSAGITDKTVDPSQDGAQHADEDGVDSESTPVRQWREQSRKRNESRQLRHKRPRWMWWAELPILLLVAFLLTFLIQTFVARVYYVPSGSMEHTLHGVKEGGDRILVYKLVYDLRYPKQGEVVVFKGPPNWTPEASIPGPSSWIGKVGQALGSVVGIAPPNEKDFVKRVIAVGGQTVSCCDEQGRVQVDGVSLNEPYLFIESDNPQWEWIEGVDSCAIDSENPTRYRSHRCFGPYTVPSGTVWVMGDHRSDSADSTWNCRGLVPSDRVQCQGPVPVDDVIGKAVAIVMPPSRWGGIDSPDIMSSDGG